MGNLNDIMGHYGVDIMGDIMGWDPIGVVDFS